MRRFATVAPFTLAVFALSANIESEYMASSAIMNPLHSEVTTAMLRGVDVLIHLAAHGVDPSAATWKDCFQVNVHDAMQLLLCALQAGIRNFIVAGSCFEYGYTGSAMKYQACISS